MVWGEPFVKGFPQVRPQKKQLRPCPRGKITVTNEASWPSQKSKGFAANGSAMFGNNLI